MAAPTYFHSASNPADNGSQGDNSTVVVTPPGSMSAGQLVIVVTCMRIASPTTPAVSEAGGQSWSSASTVAGTLTHMSVFWCRFTGSWSASPSWTFANETGTIPCTVTMHVFTPAATGIWTVDTAIAGGVEASADPVVITGITPAHNDNVVLAGWIVPNASTWGTISGAGWAVVETAQYRNTAGSDTGAAFAYQLQGTRGATGDVSLKPSTAAAGGSFTMAWYATAITPLTAPISDSQGTNLSDAPSGSFKYFASSTETVPLTDNTTPLLRHRGSFSDNSNTELTDSLAHLNRLLASFTDDASLALIDSLLAMLPIMGQGINESLNAIERDLASMSDSLSLSDASLTARLVYLGQLSESYPGLTDTLVALLRHLAQTGESSTTTDLIIGTLVLIGDELIDGIAAIERDLAGISDSLSLSDSTLSARLVHLSQLSEDYSSLLDTVSALFKHRAQISDDASLDLADLVARVLNEMVTVTPINVPISEDVSPSLVDNVTVLQGLLSQIFDSLSWTDVTGALERSLASVGDDASGSDLVTALFRFLAQISDLTSETDAASSLERLIAGITTESVVITDTLVALLRQLAQFSDSIPSTDSASLLNRLAAGISESDIPLTDDLLALLRQLARISDDFSASLADEVIKLLVEVGQATPLSYTFGDDVSLGLSDSLTTLHRLLSIASEALSVSDLASALSRHLAPIGDSNIATDLIIGTLVLIGDELIDGLDAIQRDLASLSDAVSLDDSALTARLVQLAQAQESYTGVLDSLSALLRDLARGSEDVSGGLADLAEALLVLIGQATPLNISISDDVSAALADSLLALQTLLATSSEQLTYADLLGALSKVLAGLADDAGLIDTIGGRFNYLAQIGDDESLSLADRIAAILVSMGIISVEQRIRIGHFIDGFTHWSR